MSTGRQSFWKDSPARWPLAGIAVLALTNLIINRQFFSIEYKQGHFYGTIVDIFQNGSICMVLALGMTLVIATGGIDLSVGSVMAIVSAVAATLLHNGQPVVVACAVGLGVGMVCGLVNGILVSVARIQPIVATLVLMVAGRGIAQLVTGGFQVSIDDEHYKFLGQGFVLGVPIAPMLVTVIYLLVWIWLRRSATGLFIEAAGDNATASRFAGLATGRITCLAYVICGVCAALGGMFASANIGNANPLNDGLNMELDAIFAVVLGGTALSGGRFNLLGTYIGAIMLQTLTETMYFVIHRSEVSPVPKAVVIIFVCLLQSETTRRWFASLRSKKAAA